jgi:hypothetical protein
MSICILTYLCEIRCRSQCNSVMQLLCFVKICVVKAEITFGRKRGVALIFYILYPSE